MPKAKGTWIGTRINREEVSFSFEYGKERVRCTRKLSELIAWCKGRSGDKPPSNLGPGAEPMTFEDFARLKYLAAAERRLPNPRSYKPEADHVRALSEELGKRSLHEIRGRDAEGCKAKWGELKYSNSTIKKRLGCLRRIMAYAVRWELVVDNPIPAGFGLRVESRRKIWLRTAEIDRLLECCSPIIRDLVEYMVLTGARITEALDFRVGDLRDGTLWVPTEKRGRPMREAMRSFEVNTLGARFAALITRLKPHPVTGFYFYVDDDSVGHLSLSYANRLFNEAKVAAGLPHIHMHDLRGTFAMHRAIVVKMFRQIQKELGHGDPRSAQSYLDDAENLSVRESIFYNEAIAAMEEALRTGGSR